MIKLRPIIFGDCMEVLSGVTKETEYFKKEESIDILTGESRSFLFIDGRVEIISYMPDRKGIWFFPN